MASVACVLAMGSLVACGDNTNTNTSSTSTTTMTTEEVGVLDGTYTSTSVTGHDLVDGSTITLEFSGVQLSFNAGCNSTSGTYTLVDRVLTLTGDAASTLMGCEDDLMAQDQWLVTLLTSGATVSNDAGPSLTLTSGDVTIDFVQGPTA